MDSIKIKLAVDRSRNRVLFADAGSDFVDVLLTFLTLPLSALQFCAASSPGCLSNLCDSVSNLADSKLLKEVGHCHGMLLTPFHPTEFGRCVRQVCCYNDTFVKNQPNLHVDGELCKCWQVMARLVHVYNEAGSRAGVKNGGWTIMPTSTSSIQTLTHRFSSDAVFHGFDEVEVCVSWAEVVSMLKASLSSDTIFSDVFLPKEGTDDPAARGAVKPSTGHGQKIVLTPNETFGSLSECKIRLFYDRKEKKVMYAECKHDFVDLLLGFSTYPLGRVIKNAREGAAACNLGSSSSSSSSFNNLYSSAANLGAAGFLTGGYHKDSLLNPSLSPFSRSRECSTLNGAVLEPEPYLGLVPYSSCRCCRRDLVEERKYMVDDDLLIYQASAMSVTKHWCGRDKANVVEMDIIIGKQKAVRLLRAMLTSMTALTDVFISRLEDRSSPRKMHIFVKFPSSTKSITVEVAGSDTIATVKSRINAKVTIPEGCRHELVYGSTRLEDLSTVAEYNIINECTISSEFLKK